jgi:MoaA/NifB/PqqE/SkfB family radical SAM enzyme
MSKKTKFICNLPWDHLSIFPHSTSSVCCEAKHENGAGHAVNIVNGRKKYLNIKHDTIESIINSDRYKSIRKEMLEGKIPEACEGCWKTEQVGGRSKRLRESWRNIDHLAITNHDGSITPNLYTIELRLGNYCNLKCRTCNAESSTSWISDYRKLKDVVELASGYDYLIKSSTTNYDWVDDPNFYDQLIDNSPNLKSIFISGGEPFLVPKHFYLLETLIRRNKTDLNISYHTNLNYDIKRLHDSLELLKKFEKVTLNFSIDDIGDRNTYIRSLSDWDLTIKNLNIFYKHYPFNYNITQTFNAYNFFYAEKLEHFLKENDIQIPIFPNHVHAPAYLSPNIFEKSRRQEKLESIKGLVSDNLYKDLFGRYYNSEPNGLYSLFLKFTKAVDNLRKENVEELFGDIFL